MTMTRQDFQLIARVIANLDDALTVGARRVVASRFADALAGTNARFDRDRFLRACEALSQQTIDH